MKNLLRRLGLRDKQEVKTNLDQKQEALIKLGREQFQRLIEKGLSLPIMTL